MVARGRQSEWPELADLRRRVDAIDAEVAKLKRQVRANGSKPAKAWWRQLAGKYDNDPVFAEIMREGRKWRAAQAHRAGTARRSGCG